MDVRVEAGPLTALGCVVESKLQLETSYDVFISSKVISRFSLAPVISIGGTSISSITPESFRIGVLAA
jgi:hypothetical protein